MKKKTRRRLLTTVVVLLVVYLGLSFFLGFVVKTAVNRVGPGITQTAVTLSGAHISPLTGSGVLSGLSVANPPGWSPGRAFYFGRVAVSLKPFSIFGDHIVIDEMVIDQPEFTYETRLFSSNVGDLLKNIGDAQSNGVATTDGPAKKGRPIRFEIRHLLLTRGKVSLGVGSAELPLPLPTIELHDIGTGEGGITSDQLALAVMKSVSSGIVGATTNAAGKIGATAGAAAAEGVKKTGERIKKLLGGK